MDDALQLDDTIAALASAPGPAVRGIVRISGADVRQLLESRFEPENAAAWDTAARAMRHPGAILLPGLHLPLLVDVLLWPTSRSYTGQPLAEIHTIGSPPLLEAILSVLFEQGVRPAQRGEFTLRAFLAGRIDLLQAEAVLGVIDATDQQQLQLALGQLGGGLSNQIAQLHEELLLHLADLEAGLDFVEEDIEFVRRDVLVSRLDEGRAFLRVLLDRTDRQMLSTGRRRVVLAGLPNAGKSTLFNALVGDERAIVSSVAGTTRDYLSAAVDCDGLTIELIDTAGQDKCSTAIAQLADQLRQQQSQTASLVVWCTPRDDSGDAASTIESLGAIGSVSRQPPLCITTKGDCGAASHSDAEIVVTATTGAGLGQLRQAIAAHLTRQCQDESILGSTAARCRESLQGALQAIMRARQATCDGLGDEYIALELREAIDHLGKVVGRVYTDDVLDRIFSRFCIGK